MIEAQAVVDFGVDMRINRIIGRHHEATSGAWVAAASTRSWSLRLSCSCNHVRPLARYVGTLRSAGSLENKRSKAKAALVVFLRILNIASPRDEGSEWALMASRNLPIAPDSLASRNKPKFSNTSASSNVR